MNEERMKAALQAIMATEPDELSCADLTPEQRSLYVESELAGEDPRHKYPHLAHHLRHCPDCAEEIADLRLMLEYAQQELPRSMESPTFDLSFLQSKHPISAIEAARSVVERFFREEAPLFDLVSERFFAQVKKLRAQQATSPETRRPGWLEKLSGWLEGFSRWQAAPGMPLSESKDIQMTLKVLMAATRMEEVLASHQAVLAAGGTLPESVLHELTGIGQETGLPIEATTALIKALYGPTGDD